MTPGVLDQTFSFDRSITQNPAWNFLIGKFLKFPFSLNNELSNTKTVISVIKNTVQQIRHLMATNWYDKFNLKRFRKYDLYASQRFFAINNCKIRKHDFKVIRVSKRYTIRQQLTDTLSMNTWLMNKPLGNFISYWDALDFTGHLCEDLIVLLEV